MAFLKQKKKPSFQGGGLLLFADVAGAMKAERILKKDSYEVKLVAPPPDLRKGCDLALEINLAEHPGIERVLKEKNAEYLGVTPLEGGSQEPLEVVKVTDFGGWTMVKAGNMKLTFDKKSGVIINTSGGGCPDIPFLHAEMVGRRLDESPRPKDIGFTLCALMLERALEECIHIWQQGEES